MWFACENILEESQTTSLRMFLTLDMYQAEESIWLWKVKFV